MAERQRKKERQRVREKRGRVVCVQPGDLNILAFSHTHGSFSTTRLLPPFFFHVFVGGVCFLCACVCLCFVIPTFSGHQSTTFGVQACGPHQPGSRQRQEEDLVNAGFFFPLLHLAFGGACLALVFVSREASARPLPSSTFSSRILRR